MTFTNTERGLAVTPRAVAAEVTRWFGEVRGASLELPSGWFGRPFDNLHKLSEIRVESGDDVVLVLDGVQELTVHAPQSVASASTNLVIGPIAGGTWKWAEYGSGKHHVEVIGPGTVTFWAPRGT